MEGEIINRVAKSGLITLDLADYFPKEEIVELDIKDWLFHGLILKEQDFRARLEEHDWAQYRDKHVTLFCSADAIIPLWGYMLLASKLQPLAMSLTYGRREDYLDLHFHDALKSISPQEYADKRVVIKGCGDKDVPASAYVEITSLLLPYAKTIMYGEPCSTVPVYKKAK